MRVPSSSIRWVFRVGVLFAVFAVFFIYTAPKTEAHHNYFSVAFNKDRIIEDSVFVNTGSMSASSIQSFLANHTEPDPGTLLPGWTDQVDIYDPVKTDVNGNRCNIHRATNKSAATIIHEAATAFSPQYIIIRDVNGNVTNYSPGWDGPIGSCSEPAYTCLPGYSNCPYQNRPFPTINPQAIIATLQKEQGLISADGGYSNFPEAYDNPTCCGNDYKLAWAMGFGVPDSGNKNHKFKGFYNQVFWGSYQFRYNYERATGCHNGWDGTSPGNCPNPALGSCGYKVGSVCNISSGPGQTESVHLSNGTTASLYRYTPHTYASPCFCRFGNHNFSDYMALWFSPSYSWARHSLTYERGNTYIPSTEKEKITLVARNTGSATWTNSGSNPVRLGTWGPADRSSAFSDPSWVQQGIRPAQLKESSVAPGELGTFEFLVQAPSPGNYTEKFNLVAENLTFMKGEDSMFFEVAPVSFSGDYVSDTFPTNLSPNQTAQVTVAYKNTSNVAWYKTGNAPLRIGSYDPPDHPNVFAHSSWLSNNRAVVMNEDKVPAGSNATFTFTIQAPSTTGDFSDNFAPVAEHWSWVHAPITKTISNLGTFKWELTELAHSSGTALMDPGDTQTITVRAKNTGTETWTKSGSLPVRVGTWPPQRLSAVEHSSWIFPTRPGGLIEESVAPGAIGTFTFTVRAPYSSEFTERINLVAENWTWFNDAGANFYLKVRGGWAWQLVDINHSTSTAALPRGSTVTLALRARNVGDITWKKGGDFPVRLGTENPKNRGSVLYRPSWIRDYRPVGLLEDTVPPGGIGTFTFEAQVPNNPGEYFEYFSLVAEHISWFNNPNVYIYIKSM